MRDSSLAVKVMGLWALWRAVGIDGKTETSVDRLRELGIPRTTAYKRLQEFRDLTGLTWPSEIGAGELVEVLRRRQQQVLPLEASDVG